MYVCIGHVRRASQYSTGSYDDDDDDLAYSTGLIRREFYEGTILLARRVYPDMSPISALFKFINQNVQINIWKNESKNELKRNAKWQTYFNKFVEFKCDDLGLISSPLMNKRFLEEKIGIRNQRHLSQLMDKLNSLDYWRRTSVCILCGVCPYTFLCFVRSRVSRVSRVCVCVCHVPCV